MESENGGIPEDGPTGHSNPIQPIWFRTTSGPILAVAAHSGDVWLTRAGEIAAFAERLPAGLNPGG